MGQDLGQETHILTGRELTAGGAGSGPRSSYLPAELTAGGTGSGPGSSYLPAES